VLTSRYDNARTGANTNEFLLTPANVNVNTFGRLFTYPVDGYVYTQPLYVANLAIPGQGTHNVVIIATEHNTVYAFDADSNLGTNGGLLWQTNLGVSILSDNGEFGNRYAVQYPDLIPNVGITGTPVIDLASGTIYMDVVTREVTTTTNYVHRIQALNITNGVEQPYGPVVVTASVPGKGVGGTGSVVPFDPRQQLQRPGMTLAGGILFAAYGGYADTDPYHGWVLGFNAANLQQLTNYVFCTTPNATINAFGAHAGEGAVWMDGNGLCVDANTNIYFETGNGSFSANTNGGDYSDSIVKLSTTNKFVVADYFTPFDQATLAANDTDLGSGGPLVLPDSVGSAAHPHLIVGCGKEGKIYLVDRDNMGRWNGTADQIVQEFNGSAGGDRDTTPAFFNNALYVYDSNGRIGAYSITNALFNTTPVETPDGYANKGGATPCISANGTSNAIVWALANSGLDSPTTPCVLRAYNATNLTQELYTSDQIPSRDSAGDAVKFTAPTIANGKVYVGAQYSLTVYGIAQTFVDTPIISPNGGVYTNSVMVSISDATAGASIYYTLDGSVPTTNSTLYSGPFVLTTSAAVTAGAFKPGAVASGTTTVSFINSSAVGSGTGLQGEYWANTTSGAFLTPGFDTPPTTNRIDPTIDFDWNTTQPFANVGPDVYVVQWTGAVEPQFSETYTFSTTTDDGVLLYVNGQLLVNEWVDQGPTTWSGTIALVAQQRYNITMDYYQNGGGAEAYLYWSSPSTGPMTIIPESQLYPVTNPPPSVSLIGPSNNATYTASASVSLSADAAAQYNTLNGVSFYIGSTLLGTVSNAPYSLTTTGVAAGSYTLTAVAVDGSGLSTTSAPVNITVNAASGSALRPDQLFVRPGLLQHAGHLHRRGHSDIIVGDGGLLQHARHGSGRQPDPVCAQCAVVLRQRAESALLLGPQHRRAVARLPNKSPYAPTNTWSFPSGTVFVKTFELQTNTSDPTSLLRLETRLLVRDTNGAVYGVTYKWRSDYSDADLLTTNLTEPSRFKPRAACTPTCGIIPAPVIVCSATRPWPIMCWGSMRAS
jgi:hypothetical protein